MESDSVIRKGEYILAPAQLVWLEHDPMPRTGPTLLGYLVRDFHGRDGWNWVMLNGYRGKELDDEPFPTRDDALTDLIEFHSRQKPA